MQNTVSETQSLWSPYLLLLIPIIAGWITTFIQGKNQRKESREEHKNELEKLIVQAKLQETRYTEQNKIVMDRLSGFENKLIEISYQILEDKKNWDFQLNIMNMFRTEATTLIDFNVDLDSKYKNLLMRTAREFEDFALRFYYSNMRGKKRIEKYLRIDIDSRLAFIESAMRQINTKIRIFEYTVGNKKPIEFIQYIKASGLYLLVDNLVDRLEINGFKDGDEVIILFQDFLDDFFKEMIRLINRWEELEIFDVDEDEFERLIQKAEEK